MRKRRSSAIKRICAVALLVSVVFAFAGCSEQIEEPQTEKKIVFTDGLGREVKLEKRPERVAALLGSFAEVWTLSGGTLCAAAEDAWSDFGLDLGDAVNIGGVHSPSVEKLLSADPDFVLAGAYSASNTDMKDTLEQAGIAVAYFDVTCFEDYLSMLGLCTDITGRKDLYEKNGTEIGERIDAVKNRLAAADIPESERSVLFLRATSGSVKVKGSEGTVLGEMLRDLGFVNIADSDNTLLENLNAESVIHRNPYRIFAVTMGDDTVKATENLNKLLEENPAWGSLDAVADGRVYVMDKKLFGTKPNARWADAYEQLAEILLDKTE